MDVGAGRGGDILKYKDIAERIYFLEPSQDIEECKTRA